MLGNNKLQEARSNQHDRITRLEAIAGIQGSSSSGGCGKRPTGLRDSRLGGKTSSPCALHGQGKQRKVFEDHSLFLQQRNTTVTTQLVSKEIHPLLSTCDKIDGRKRRFSGFNFVFHLEDVERD
jgi:hypothetical protein